MIRRSLKSREFVSLNLKLVAYELIVAIEGNVALMTEYFTGTSALHLMISCDGLEGVI